MGRLIRAIPFSDLSQLVVTMEDFGDKQYAGLRVWWRRREGEPFKPSRKGVVFTLDLLDDVIGALRQIEHGLAKRKARSGAGIAGEQSST